MKTHRVVLTESLLFFHEDQRFPQTFAEYTKKEEQKESRSGHFLSRSAVKFQKYFARVRIIGTLVSFYVIGNFKEFPIT